MNAKEKEEFLAGIENPAVRAHYAAQLEMADEWQGEDVGGIFGIPTDWGGEPAPTPVRTTSFVWMQGEIDAAAATPPRRATPNWRAVAAVVLLVVVLGLWPWILWAFLSLLR